MNSVLTWTKVGFAFIGGVITACLGGWDLMLKVLVGAVIIDYVLGVVAAWYTKTINSRVGARGIVRKILYFVVVGMGYWLDVLMGTEMLRSIVICAFIANEGFSILENLGRCDVYVPEPIKGALEQLKKKGDSFDG